MAKTKRQTVQAIIRDAKGAVRKRNRAHEKVLNGGKLLKRPAKSKTRGPAKSGQTSTQNQDSGIGTTPANTPNLGQQT